MSAIAEAKALGGGADRLSVNTLSGLQSPFRRYLAKRHRRARNSFASRFAAAKIARLVPRLGTDPPSSFAWRNVIQESFRYPATCAAHAGRMLLMPRYAFPVIADRGSPVPVAWSRRALWVVAALEDAHAT